MPTSTGATGCCTHPGSTRGQRRPCILFSSARGSLRNHADMQHSSFHSMQLKAAHTTHKCNNYQLTKFTHVPGRSCCSHRVHKEHHESFNPDPFSGLSMHWAESTIYFSSALLISPIVPLWVFRLLSLGLLVSVSSCTYLPFSTHLSFKQHQHKHLADFPSGGTLGLWQLEE